MQEFVASVIFKNECFINIDFSILVKLETRNHRFFFILIFIIAMCVCVCVCVCECLQVTVFVTKHRMATWLARDNMLGNHKAKIQIQSAKTQNQ